MCIHIHAEHIRDDNHLLSSKKCTTGGKPSTWFPPERLVEQAPNFSVSASLCLSCSFSLPRSLFLVSAPGAVLSFCLLLLFLSCFSLLLFFSSVLPPLPLPLPFSLLPLRPAVFLHVVILLCVWPLSSLLCSPHALPACHGPGRSSLLGSTLTL